MRRLLALLMAGALLTSCTGDRAVDTTLADTSTSSRPETTTTVEGQATTTAPLSTTSTTSPDPLAPEGSGCTPGPGELPDGEWYGGVRGFDEQGVSFDLACFFVGDAATAAAAEDGEESPPPNDYYVRNQNEQVRELTVGPDIPVIWYPTGDPNDAVHGSYQNWIEHLATQESYLALWVTIDDGMVTMIEEQWVP